MAIGDDLRELGLPPGVKAGVLSVGVLSTGVILERRDEGGRLGRDRLSDEVDKRRGDESGRWLTVPDLDLVDRGTDGKGIEGRGVGGKDIAGGGVGGRGIAGGGVGGGFSY